jgi:hypothetical protein
MADSPQSFTAHLKPQFAPIEQYAEEAGGMRQGPWTDLYALGATLYFVLTGRAPTPSVVRAVRDVLPTLASQRSTMGVRASMLAAIDWALALAPEQRPQNVLSMRRALSGEVAPPPPSPRQLGAAVAAVAPDSVRVGDAALRADRAPGARAPRRWFSRLTATFWGPAVETDPKPSPLRRRAGVSAAVALALMGSVALGWGAWTFNRPSRSPSDAVATTAAAATATTAGVATSQVPAAPVSMSSPTSTLAPTPSPTSTPAETQLTPRTPTSTTTPASALSPVRLPVTSSAADPVVMWAEPEPERAAAAAADAGPRRQAVSPVRPRSTAAASVASQTARTAPRERPRATHPRVQTASAGAKSSRTARSACDGSGLLARAWCALHPCKAPRGRANPECIERLRAEAARQQRIERQ